MVSDLASQVAVIRGAISQDRQTTVTRIGVRIRSASSLPWVIPEIGLLRPPLHRHFVRIIAKTAGMVRTVSTGTRSVYPLSGRSPTPAL
jgi:hypothetical protein